MAETLLDQPEATSLGWNDILYAVTDPAGAPADCKITKANLLAAVLKALAELTPAADKIPRFTGAATADLVDASAAGLALLGAADTAAQRAALGLAVGSDVQAYDAELAALAALTSAADKLPYFTGAGAAALTTLSAFVRTLLATTSEDQFRGRVNAMQRLAWIDVALDAAPGDGVGLNMTTTGGSRTVTLADPTTFTNSNALNAVRLAATSGSSTCTVAPSAGWTIEGTSALVLRYAGELVVLQALASGNKWRVLVDGRTHAPAPFIAAGDVAAVGNRNYGIDASGASRTVTLPAAPAANDWVGVSSTNAQGSNTITIDRNGNTLLGTAANLTFTVLGEHMILQWDAGSSDWRAIVDGRLCNANRPGKVPALPADATKYLDGTGVFSVPTRTVFENVLLNGEGAMFARQTPGTLTARSDDTYGADRWNSLSQTASIQWQRGTGINVSPYSFILKQHQASAQRMGTCQIVEGVNARPLRGQAIMVQGQMKYSNNAAVRYALLEWTGTEDAVTSDPVNDWTSGTYTGGNFFVATNFNVLAVGATTPAAATTTAWNLTATVGAAAKNLFVVIWTEGTAAQNSTLELSEIDLFVGAATRVWMPRPIAAETLLCRRYCQPLFDPSTHNRLFGTKYGTKKLYFDLSLPVPLRTAGTLISSSPTWATAAPTANTIAAFDSLANAYATIVGALTIAGASSPLYVSIEFTAGTSFSGTSGGVYEIAIGPQTDIVFDAEL